MLAGEDERNLIIPRTRFAKLLESSVGVRPRHNLIISAITPVDLPNHHRQVLLVAAHHTDQRSLHC